MLCLCGYTKPAQARLHGAPRTGGPTMSPDLQVWGARMVQGKPAVSVCSMPYLLPALPSMYGKGGGGLRGWPGDKKVTCPWFASLPGAMSDMSAPGE